MGIENLLRHYIPEVTRGASRCRLSRPLWRFDTSAAHCAAALLSGTNIIAHHADNMARGQGEHLMGLLQDLLDGAGHGWCDLTALGVGIGPGNFTGIRISVSAARGLALSLGIPAIGVSSFEATALAHIGPFTTSVPAPREQLYTAIIFGRRATGATACQCR